MLQLENLSWEIFHLIFDYLNTYDLLNAFRNLNENLITILNSYHRIQLNFKRIKKTKFDFICQHVQCEQIQSIYLADDDYTPNQIETFMSLIPLIKCSNLQSIRIEHISNADLLNLLVSHLDDHQQLRSLNIQCSSISINKKTDNYISDVLSNLPELKYLQICSSSILVPLKSTLNQLTHLTIDLCKQNELSKFLQWIPNLIYLHISNSYGDQTVELNVFLEHLKCLIIQSRVWMLFDHVEKIFSMTPNLQRLQLETSGEFALLNGNRWESIIKSKVPHLKQFTFDISPEENTLTKDAILQTFQTPFWLLEKHCRVACMISTVTDTCVRLFSIPPCQPVNDWYPPSEGFAIHSSVSYQFNDYINEISISHFPVENDINSLIKLKSVRTLTVYCPIHRVEQLEQIMNLTSIQHLIVNRLIDGSAFSELLQSAFNINQLTIKSKGSVPAWTSFAVDKFVFEQIKTLNAQDQICKSEQIDALSQIFPRLEYLRLRLEDKADIISICKKFPCLIGAVIDFNVPVKNIEEFFNENEICLNGSYKYEITRLRIWMGDIY